MHQKNRPRDATDAMMLHDATRDAIASVEHP